MELDNVKGRELSCDDVERFHNELRAIEYLASGLNYLNAQVSHIEAEVRGKSPEIGEHFGDVPGLEWLPKGLVACSFHWYSVTVCNYVLLVGWLLNDGCSDDVRTEKAKNYQKAVLGNVLQWRHKVGAHFAQAVPHKKDNLAVRTLSVTFPIAFRDGAFWAPPFTVSFTPVEENPKPEAIADWRWRHLRRSTSKPGTPSSKPERTPKCVTDTSGPELAWSLTRTHRELSERYSNLVQG